MTGAAVRSGGKHGRRATAASLAAVLWLGAASQLGCCKLAGSGGGTQATPAPPETPSAPDTPPPVAVTPTAPGAAPTGPDPKLARNFYVVFDGSGSMRERSCAGKFGRKMPAAQWAFKEFLNAIAPEDNLGLLLFDRGGLREVVALGAGNRPAVEKAVDAIDAGLGTPLGPAIELGVKALAERQASQLGYGEYHLVVVTDGRADDGSALKRAVKRASDSGALIHTIGFCIAADNALQKASYSFRTANDPEELRAAVVGVLAESEDFQPMTFEQVR